MISKRCKKHGDLKPEDIRIDKKYGREYKNCVICRREYQQKQTLSGKRKELSRKRRLKPDFLEKRRMYDKNYHERRLIVAKAMYERKKNDPCFKEKNNKRSLNRYKVIKESFHDSYVKKVLRFHKDATPEICELKRQIILLKRIIRAKR